MADLYHHKATNAPPASQIPLPSFYPSVFQKHKSNINNPNNKKNQQLQQQQHTTAAIPVAPKLLMKNKQPQLQQQQPTPQPPQQAQLPKAQPQPKKQPQHPQQPPQVSTPLIEQSIDLDALMMAPHQPTTTPTIVSQPSEQKPHVLTQQQSLPSSAQQQPQQQTPPASQKPEQDPSSFMFEGPTPGSHLDELEALLSDF